MIEREPARELEQELVAAFAATFIPRWDRYPVQASSGRYIQLPWPLTLDLVAAHLEDYRHQDRQTVTIGAYALNEQSHSKWVCFDADRSDEWDALLGIAASLGNQGVRAYLEQSRRGGHLWLFTPQMSGCEARQFGHQLLWEYRTEKVEVYPKQNSLGGIEGGGSFIRLPLGLHRKDGKVHHFINLDGTPLAPTITEQVMLLAAPQIVPQDFVTEIVNRAPEQKSVSPTPAFEKLKQSSGEKLSDRLKARVSVYDFVSQFVPIDERGIGHCPFHDDEHHSFQVNIRANYWNCYADKGCGGGSLIDFWSRYRVLQGKDSAFIPTITELAAMLL